MKQTIVVNTGLDMGTGKLAAQVAHASLQAYEAAGKTAQREWKSGGQKKIVVKGNDATHLQELADQSERGGVPYALIRDAGHTQLEPGSVTALAVGPASPAAVDKVTGELSLY